MGVKGVSRGQGYARDDATCSMRVSVSVKHADRTICARKFLTAAADALNTLRPSTSPRSFYHCIKSASGMNVISAFVHFLD